MKIHQLFISPSSVQKGGAEWLVPLVSRCLERSQQLCPAAAGCGCWRGRPNWCREPLLAADVCSALGTPGGADAMRSVYNSIHYLSELVWIHRSYICTYPIVTFLPICCEGIYEKNDKRQMWCWGNWPLSFRHFSGQVVKVLLEASADTKRRNRFGEATSSGMVQTVQTAALTWRSDRGRILPT